MAFKKIQLKDVLKAWIGCLVAGASLLVCRGQQPAASASGGETATIATIAELYDSTDTAEMSRAVRIQATVLYCDPKWGLLFLWDGSSYSYFPFPRGLDFVGAGEEVVIHGDSQASESPSRIRIQKIDVLNAKDLPPPQPEPASAEEFGAAVNRLVEATGTLRAMDRIDGHMRLLIHSDNDHLAQVVIRDFDPADLKQMIDARVRVRGVFVLSSDDEGIKTDFTLFMQTSRSMEVVRQGVVDYFDLPETDLRAIHEGGRNIRPGAGLQIKATVREVLENGNLVVGDASRSILLRGRTKSQVIKGERVEAAGFLSYNIQGNPVLESAVYRIVREPDEASNDGGLARSDDPAVLRTAGAVRQLTQEEANQGRPVLIQAVVTYYDSQWGVLFLQDETAGIYVNSGNQTFQIDVGDRVEVEGVTEPGGYAPVIDHPTIRLIQKAEGLPPAKPLTMNELLTGGEDSRWSELKGVVRSVKSEFDHFHLLIGTRDGEFYATIPKAPVNLDPGQFVDAAVRIRGVCGVTHNEFRQLTGINLHTPDWSFIEIIGEQPGDPFELEAKPIRRLLTFSPRSVFEHRVKIQGVTTYVGARKNAFIEDESGAVQVRFVDEISLVPGDEVEVVGFPSAGDFTPELEEAVFRKTKSGVLPPAPSVSAPDLLRGIHHAGRVNIEGRLLDIVEDRDEARFVMEADKNVFHAYLPNGAVNSALSDVPIGSRLSLTGVCLAQADEWRRIRTFQIHLNAPSDVRILSLPRWWSFERMMKGAGLVGGLSLLMMAWAFSLRRTVKKQTGIIREKMEQELIHMERYHGLFQNSTDLIFILDPEGRVVDMNRAAETACDSSVENMKGRPFSELIGEEKWALMRESLMDLKADETMPEQEHELVFVGREPRRIEIKARAIHENGMMKGYQCAARDTTQRRFLEEQLSQAQKMECVGQLTAGVAHDYNNILTVIQGHMEMLLSEHNWPAESMDSLKEVSNAAERATNLNRQLLMFSRRHVMKQSDENLNELIEGLAGMLRRLIGEHIQLHFTPESNLPGVNVDRAMFEQVVLNLCVNARDAMPGGGFIRMATRLANVEPGAGALPARPKPGSYVCLSFADSGTGMDAATRNRIFEPFFTTKEAGKGTGLGLSTVHGIVAQHNGWIDVQSAPGNGTVFEVYIPVSGTGKRDPVQPDAESMESIDGHETILLVEDDMSVIQVIQRTLTRRGYHVLTSSNALHALERWKDAKDEIDLLITDILMPGGMLGDELANRLQRDKPELKVIYSTGYHDRWAGKNLHLKPTERLLKKPYTPSRLLASVRECLAEEPALIG